MVKVEVALKGCQVVMSYEQTDQIESDVGETKYSEPEL